MALKAGRRGLNRRLVDAFGNMKNSTPSGDLQESAVYDIVNGANAVNNKLYKTGHVVSCNIVLLNVNVSGGGIIFKIPNGYIPTTAFYALNISNVTGDNVEIKTNGVINAQHDITDGIIVLSTTWITE